MALRRADTTISSTLSTNESSVITPIWSEKSLPKLAVPTIVEVNATENVAETLPPKDTGFAAYTVLAAVTFVQSACFAMPVAFGVWQEYYAHRYVDHRLASWIGVLSIAFPFMAAPGITWCCQHFTLPREAYVMTGMSICLLSLLLSAFLESMSALVVVQGLMYGLGASLVDVPALIVLNSWFDARRGMAYGICFGGLDLLGVGYTFLGSVVLTRLSFRYAMITIFAVTAAIAVPALFFIGERIDPTPEELQVAVETVARRRSSTKIEPEFVKIARSLTSPHFHSHKRINTMDNEHLFVPKPLSRAHTTMATRNFASPIRTVTHIGDLPFSPSLTRRDAWPLEQPAKPYYKRALFYVFGVANLLQGCAYYLPFIYLPTYATSLGLSRQQGTIILALANFAQVIGDLGFGKLSDKVHVNYLIMASTAVSCVSTFVLWGVLPSHSNPFAVLLVYGLLFGVFGAGFITLWARMGTLFGERDAQMVYSMLCAGRGIAGVSSGGISQALVKLGTPSALAVFGKGQYGTLITFVGVCNAIAALMGAAAIAALHVGKVKVESRPGSKRSNRW